MRMPLKSKQLYTKPLCRSFDMENSLLAGTGVLTDNSMTGGSGDVGTGDFEEGKTAKDFDFSQEGGAWEEAKRYDSSLFGD